MEFTTTEHKNCHVIAVSGRIDSYTSPKIEEELKSLFSEGHCNIVIDFSDVTYLSSSGMLVFINAEKKCRLKDQGRVLLSRVPPQILSSLKLAGFDQIFEITPDIPAAINRF
ncbi:MAG: STAS domain-containing protein [Chloroflexota bacterium]|nr:STAS domain-containing protein [Chloroflexota bacterium]